MKSTTPQRLSQIRRGQKVVENRLNEERHQHRRLADFACTIARDPATYDDERMRDPKLHQRWLDIFNQLRTV